MAYLADIQYPVQVKDVKQVMDYLRQMEDQLRYVIAHIGPENTAQPGGKGRYALGAEIGKGPAEKRKQLPPDGRGNRPGGAPHGRGRRGQGQ